MEKECIPELQIDKNYFALHFLFGQLMGNPLKEHEGFYETRLDASPWENFLFSFALKEDRLSQEIEEIKRKIKTGLLPNKIATGPSTKPANLPQKLLESGFLLTNQMKGMALRKEAFVLPKPSDNYLRMYKISNEKDLWDWVNIVVKYLFLKGKEEAKVFHNLCCKTLQKKACCLFLGKIDSLPVTASMLFTNAHAGGIYFVATNSDFRKRGYGSMITAIAIQEGMNRGLCGFILHSSEEGEGVYKRLGFTEIAPVRRFYLP